MKVGTSFLLREMRNKILLLILFTASFIGLKAQDVIETMDGEKYNARVVSMSETEVVFKDADNPGSPAIVKKYSEIYKISFEGGHVEQYSNTPPVKKAPPPAQGAVIMEPSTASTEQEPPPSSTGVRSRPSMLIYSPSQNADWSLYIAEIKENWGFIMGIRTNFFWLANPMGEGIFYDENIDALNEGTAYTPVTGVEREKSKTSMTFGVVNRISEDWLYWYGAAGFGMLLEYQLYDQWLTSNTGGFFGSPSETTYSWDKKVWLADLKKSAIGLEVEGGLLFDFGPTFTAGFTSTNFGNFYWTMGVGFSY
jgi:hypothetical protein